MGKSIEFIVPGDPQGKARPKVFRNPYTGRAHGVTPEKTVRYEAEIAWRYKEARAKAGGFAPDPALGIEVSIWAYYKVPKSYSKKVKDAIEAGQMDPVRQKPDVDNIGKAVLDALNGIAYEDDKQVTVLRVAKSFIAGDPFIKVRISQGECTP